jgi:hypothetical protein
MDLLHQVPAIDCNLLTVLSKGLYFNLNLMAGSMPCTTPGSEQG